MRFLEFFWLVVVSFAFVAYLMVLFQIIVDLFRDSTQSGWAKALWVVGLIFLPFLTALAYLIARGDGMSRRQAEAVRRAKDNTDDYIREVAGRSPAEEIEAAKRLLDGGTITQAEYDALKVKALA